MAEYQMQLHILPPGPSLPSLDRECLSTVIYLRYAVPRHLWVLVPDAAWAEGTSQDDLPLLRDGSTAVRGFDAIVNHLRDQSSGEWDLDGRLNPQQRADSLAFSSHLFQNLEPLLDLALYSSASWFAVDGQDCATSKAAAAAAINTPRSAFLHADIPFPITWLVPTAFRASKLETAAGRLGVSTADFDVAIANAGGDAGAHDKAQAASSSGTPLNDDIGQNARGTFGGALGVIGRKTTASLRDRVGAVTRLESWARDAIEPIVGIFAHYQEKGASSGGPVLSGVSIFGPSKAPTSFDCRLLAALAIVFALAPPSSSFAGPSAKSKSEPSSPTGFIARVVRRHDAATAAAAAATTTTNDTEPRRRGPKAGSSGPKLGGLEEHTRRAMLACFGSQDFRPKKQQRSTTTGGMRQQSSERRSGSGSEDVSVVVVDDTWTMEEQSTQGSSKSDGNVDREEGEEEEVEEDEEDEDEEERGREREQERGGENGEYGREEDTSAPQLPWREPEPASLAKIATVLAGRAASAIAMSVGWR